MQPSIREQIAREADEWLLQLHAAERADLQREAFTEWLMQSPTHIEAYLAVSRTWCELTVRDEHAWSTEALLAAARVPDARVNVIQLRTDRELSNSTPPVLLRSRRWAARAVGLGGVILAVAFAWLVRGYWSAQEIQTAVGEQRSITLADGSVVFLNTDSDLEIKWSTAERRINLKRGEARFQVAKNSARPFVVATEEATVRAVGTVFNVRTGESTTQVSVLEGRVQVNALPTHPTSATVASAVQPAGTPPAAQLLLAAGQRAAVTGGGVEADVGAPLERVTAWTQRRLVFRGETLSAVVAEFNRYRLQALVLDDPTLAEVRINGVFDLDDPASLVTYLANFESVRVERRADGSEHLARTPR